MANTLLFHDLHAELFHALVRIVNEIHAGAHLTHRDVLQRLQPLDPVDTSRQEELIDTMFSFSPSGEAQLFLDKPVHLPPTKAELRWLKTMLADEAAAFLLEDDLREKLLARLAKIRAYARDSWRVLRGTGDDARRVEKPLREFWRALAKGSMIFCRNVDGRGVCHESKAAPCRLEYDAAENRCRAIVWLVEESRAVKMNFSRIEEVRALEEPVSHDVEEKFRAFLAARRRSFTVRLASKNNAVERAFFLFAPYDKEAVFDEESGLYTLTVFYYDFDEQEMLEQILSLGSAAVVLTPEAMRQKIIAVLRDACSQDS
jgi:hypothetical protein